MKYCGGKGSNTGTKNLTTCSSVPNLLKTANKKMQFLTTQSIHSILKSKTVY